MSYRCLRCVLVWRDAKHDIKKYGVPACPGCKRKDMVESGYSDTLLRKHRKIKMPLLINIEKEQEQDKEVKHYEPRY